MVTHRCSVILLSLLCAAAVGIPTAEVPPRSADGQTLVVPQSQRELGEVYYVVAGAGTQLSWESDAPLLRSVATCNRGVGYFVAPFELEQGKPPLLGGALRVPVASLRSGYGVADGARPARGAYHRNRLRGEHRFQITGNDSIHERCGQRLGHTIQLQTLWQAGNGRAIKAYDPPCFSRRPGRFVTRVAGESPQLAH